MKLCMPVTEDKGMDSPLCEHFGSAPWFLIVETDTLACKTIANANSQHAHGMCQPLSVLSGEDFDGIIVGGIGQGALNRLKTADIKVYKSGSLTVKAAADEFKGGKMREIDPQSACTHHGHGPHYGHIHN